MKKNENGSISLYVLVACLFFVIVLMSQYVGTVGKLQETEEEIRQIQDNYRGYTTYKDINGDEAPIPNGFYVSQKSNENVIKNGLVVSDVNGNEFVWIPCTKDAVSGKVQYKRTEWSVEVDGNDNARATKDELTLTNSNVTYSDSDKNNGITANISKEIVAQVNAEKASVGKYGGYYIGRYEAGKNGNSIVVKQSQAAYTNIGWSQAYNLSKGFYNCGWGTSYLCSSYALDTAINYMKKDSNKFNIVNRVDGIFSTEINPGTSETIILRNSSCSSGRYDVGSGSGGSSISFRIAMFLK